MEVQVARGLVDVEAPAQAPPEGESASSSAGSSGADPDKSRPGWRGLLTPAQRLYCIFALLAELLLIWLWQESLTLRPATDWYVYLVAHLMLISLYPRAKPPPPAARAAPAPVRLQQGPGGAAAGPAGGGAKARTFFVDSVKILCTELVLIHHVSMAFGGAGGLSWSPTLGGYSGNTFGVQVTNWLLTTDQSFFMSLLFFVGGVFTPSSLARKGVTEFVRDKLKRLGWPLVVNYFVVSPLMSGWLGVVLGEGSMLSYMRFETTVTWFLATLLTLSIAYAIIPVPEATLPMPSAAGIICACTALGAVQGFVLHCNFELFKEFPKPMGGLPFDVAFFAAGCVAKRSGWLEAVQNMPPVDYWLARSVAAVTVLAWGIAATRGGAALSKAFLSAGWTVLVGAGFGVMTGGTSLSVLHFCAAHCNSDSRLRRLAAESQYAVYVMQVITIPCVVCSFLPILRSAGHPVEFHFSQETFIFLSTDVIPQWLLMAGCLYTVALVTVIAWPLGLLFRRLPLVRDVL